MTGKELIEKLQGLPEETLELQVAMRESVNVYLEGLFEVDRIDYYMITPESKEVLFIS